jgi:hypothetical protein
MVDNKIIFLRKERLLCLHQKVILYQKSRITSNQIKINCRSNEENTKKTRKSVVYLFEYIKQVIKNITLYELFV